MFPVKLIDINQCNHHTRGNHVRKADVQRRSEGEEEDRALPDEDPSPSLSRSVEGPGLRGLCQAREPAAHGGLQDQGRHKPRLPAQPRGEGEGGHHRLHRQPRPVHRPGVEDVRREGHSLRPGRRQPRQGRGNPRLRGRDHRRRKGFRRGTPQRGAHSRGEGATVHPQRQRAPPHRRRRDHWA